MERTVTYHSHGGFPVNTSPAPQPSAELRFVMKEEKRILQQKWLLCYWGMGPNPYTLVPVPYEEEWKDVPLVEIEQEVK